MFRFRTDWVDDEEEIHGIKLPTTKNVSSLTTGGVGHTSGPGELRVVTTSNDDTVFHSVKGL